jgi:hypothetical protein
LATVGLVWAIPGIVTGKADVFPSKRGHVAEQVVRHGPTDGCPRNELRLSCRNAMKALGKPAIDVAAI